MKGAAGAHGSEAVRENTEGNHVGKTHRQVKWYDRTCRDSHNFGGVEMVQMEFLFVLWGDKTISRRLWLNFPNPVVLRHAPSFSETLSYGLQEKSIGEHLKKTEIGAESFCLALALLQWLKGVCILPWFFWVSGFFLPSANFSRDIFQPGLETSQSFINRFRKLCCMWQSWFILKYKPNEIDVVSLSNISCISALPLQ